MSALMDFVKFQLFIISCIVSFNLNAQLNSTKVHRVKDNIECLYGFKNDSNQWVISPTFTNTSEFNYGYAIVEKGGLSGVINDFGQLIIPIEYNRVNFLSGYQTSTIKGIFIAQRDHKTGLINAKNEIILPFVYAEVNWLYYGFGKIMTVDSLYGFTNKSGRVIKPEYKMVSDFSSLYLAIVSKNQKFGLIDTLGKIVVPIEYDEIISLSNTNIIKIRKGMFYGLVNSKGILLETEFDKIENGNADNLIVQKNGKYGVINAQGKYIIEPKYENIERCNENLLWCKFNGLFGLLDKKTGKIIHNNDIQRYEYIYSRHTYNFIVRINDRYGLIDNQGKIVFNPEFDDFSTSDIITGHLVFLNGDKAIGYDLERADLVPITNAMKFEGNFGKINSSKIGYPDGFRIKSNYKKMIFSEGIVNRNGKILLNPTYKISISPGALVYQDSNDLYGALNSKGDIIAVPGRFKKIDRVYYDKIVVSGNSGKCGLIDNGGKIIIDTFFFAIINYFYIGSKGYAWVMPKKIAKNTYSQYSNHYGKFIDTSNIDWCKGPYGLVDSGVHFVLPAIYDYPVKFENDIAIISINKKFGIMRIDGKEILPFEFDRIISQPNGIFILCKNDKQGLANITGKILLQPTYEHIGPFQNHIAIIDNNYKKGIINDDGEIIIKLSEDGIDSAFKDITPYMHFLQYTPKNEEVSIRTLSQLRIQKVLSPQKNIIFELIVDSKDTTIIKLCNSIMLYRVISLDDTYNTWIKDGENCNLNFFVYPKDRESELNHNKSENREKYSFEVLEITKFSFCIDQQYHSYGSTSHNIINYIYFNNGFYFAYPETLFDNKIDYIQVLNRIILEEVRKHDDLEIDCTNPNKIFDNLDGRYVLSDDGFCLFFENRKSNNKFYKIIIPYNKLKPIAAKNGLISYLIEKSENQK